MLRRLAIVSLFALTSACIAAPPSPELRAQLEQHYADLVRQVQRDADARLQEDQSYANLSPEDKASMRQLAFDVDLVDLDNDGKPEVIVGFSAGSMTNSLFCGTAGCSMDILRTTNNGLVEIASFTVFGITPLATDASGWRQLRLQGMNGSRVWAVRDGHYQPTDVTSD